MIKKFLLTLSLLGVMTLGFSQLLMAGPQFTDNGCGGCCPDYLGADSNYACEFRAYGFVDCYYITPQYSWYIVTYSTSGCLW
ncbi:MAG: hypothetical protein QNK37_38625 [Acidobacteriota bacterium]|nr:hypothetical protein [Acidobacteriota bacterium]